MLEKMEITIDREDQLFLGTEYCEVSHVQPYMKNTQQHNRSCLTVVL